MRCKHCGQVITLELLRSTICTAKDALFHDLIREEEIIDLILKKYGDNSEV